ncbi:3-oxoacyl-ACP synthase [Vibrio sp. MEBiC08052]|uniref:3-oxoacyl-ACP synthase n=1 Tax=Vibrio sp. MEBiC08052 TaxID=1761910 RepID=UPI0007407CE7|nr:3-oxoacyl-ACP synthase [Vibrio sp. MEBiC08052]KUI99681.1 hypothetical protein VRK_11270 [Vibrio sp. MEBiC08052]
MNCQIIDFDVYIPNTNISCLELSQNTGIPEEIIKEKYGINSKITSTIIDNSEDLGVKAAESLLNKTKTPPNEIDALIWVGSVNNEKMMYVTALSVAKKLNTCNAWAFDMNSMCSTMISAIEIAKTLIEAGKYKKILLVSGCKDSEYLNFKNQDTQFLINLSTGGAAVLLACTEKHTNNCFSILGSSFMSDCSLAGLCYAKKSQTHTSSYELVVDDVEYFKKRLNEVSLTNFITVINNAIKESKIKSDDIDYVAMLHMKKSAHNKIMELIGINKEKCIYLDNYGHMQQNDQFLSLKLALENKKIKEDSKILLVGAGLGFTWGATVIYWRKDNEYSIQW